MISERIQTENAIYRMIPFIENVLNWKIPRDRLLGLMGVIVNGYRHSFSDDQNILELLWWLHKSVTILKSTELYTLKKQAKPVVSV